jgi:hypothetical protein
VVSDVLWVGGMPGVGKSTAARNVARRHDLWFHAVDARTYAHAEAMDVAALRMTADELWLDRTPEQMADDFESEAHERFPLILADVDALPDDQAPVLVEGPQLLPDVVRGPTLFVTAAPELQRELVRARPSFTYSSTRDPERALTNRIARDDLLAQHLRARADVADVHRVEETEGLVERFVREHAGEWLTRPDHGDVSARRRNENDRHIDQLQRYSAVEPRAREAAVELACECGRPGCVAVVSVRLEQTGRRPLVAH